MRLSAYLSAVALLSVSDLEATLAFLEETHTVEGPDSFPTPLLDSLAATVNCDYATYIELDPVNQLLGYVACSNEQPAMHERVEPLREGERRARATCVGRAADDDGVHVRPRCAEVLLELESAYVASLALHSVSRDFGKRETLLLRALHPHLRAHHHDARLRQFADVLSVAEPVVAQLTPRELEVMRCIASGRSNAEIAELLWITPATVRKHLEHVYRKLGVRSRTAALAKLGPHRR
jgi:DNA-binding CsgD family transcriptional regulator